jgi:hypothetical protein
MPYCADVATHCKAAAVVIAETGQHSEEAGAVSAFANQFPFPPPPPSLTQLRQPEPPRPGREKNGRKIDARIFLLKRKPSHSQPEIQLSLAKTTTMMGEIAANVMAAQWRHHDGTSRRHSGAKQSRFEKVYLSIHV